MNPLLQPEVQAYIKKHEDAGVEELLLKQNSVAGVPMRSIAQQIAGRKKVKSKISDFYDCENLIYPPAVNIEQSSSQATAIFKSNLLSGDTIADLTGGFGVDSYFFARQFREVIYIESDQELTKIVKHNHRQLGALNVKHSHQSAEDYVMSLTEKLDACFIDPSRRDEQQRRVFRFQDCQPNVVELLPSLKRHFKSIFVKASPLLDISLGINELENVSQVYVVSVNNECKELLFKISESHPLPTSITTTDLSTSGEVLSEFSFLPQEEKDAIVSFGDPESFLYEPNAALLKAGAFRLVSSQFGLTKLAPSTHLYTSHLLKDNFPGKVFKINNLIKPDKREVLKFIPSGQANITTRNYPLSPDALRKKLGLRDGGDQFVIGFSGEKRKWLVIATRIR